VNAPVGRREFFTLEAGEYLERLALLTAGASPPDGQDLVRYARALRGAALMAGPAGYAVVAAAIEGVAKVVRDGGVAWSPVLAERMSQSIEECKALLHRVREWADVDRERCDRMAERLEELVGAAAKRPGLGGIGTGPGLSAGVRAYVAREAAAVAGTLEQVADVIERNPSPDSADVLLHRLQPLRGLGALPGLSPLPELLETLDLTVAFACRGGAWPRTAGPAFRATAAALSRMARDIAELGIPQHDSHEIVQAAELLREAFAHEQDVVPVSSLFADGDTDGIVSRGSAPESAPASSGVAMELSGLADRFRHAVAQTREGVSRTARSLALNALGLSVRGLALSREVSSATAGFLARVDRETMSGRALVAGNRFAEILELAVAALSTAAVAESVAGLQSRKSSIAPPVPTPSRSRPTRSRSSRSKSSHPSSTPTPTSSPSNRCSMTHPWLLLQRPGVESLRRSSRRSRPSSCSSTARPWRPRRSSPSSRWHRSRRHHRSRSRRSCTAAGAPWNEPIGFAASWTRRSRSAPI
jgi:hypothetical protein